MEKNSVWVIMRKTFDGSMIAGIFSTKENAQKFRCDQYDLGDKNLCCPEQYILLDKLNDDCVCNYDESYSKNDAKEIGWCSRCGIKNCANNKFVERMI